MANNSLIDFVSNWPDWKINVLMMDESDLRIKKIIDEYRKESAKNEQRD